MVRRAFAWALLTCLGIGQAAANTFDFEADTVGSAPTNGIFGFISDGNNGAGDPGVVVVNDASSPNPDPFGPVGNKSLQLAKILSGSDSRVRFGFEPAYPTVVTQGSVSIDFWLDPTGNSTNPSLGVQLGGGNAITQNTNTFGPVLEIYGNSLASKKIDIYGHTTYYNTLDQFVSSGAKHTLVLNFNSLTSTFTASLDGTPLTDGSGAVSSFEYAQNGGSINSLLLYNATGSDGRTFVDNVTLVVPEPASIGLLSLAAPFVLRRQRKDA